VTVGPVGACVGVGRTGVLVGVGVGVLIGGRVGGVNQGHLCAVL